MAKTMKVQKYIKTEFFFNLKCPAIVIALTFQPATNLQALLSHSSTELSSWLTS